MWMRHKRKKERKTCTLNNDVNCPCCAVCLLPFAWCTHFTVQHVTSHGNRFWYFILFFFFFFFLCEYFLLCPGADNHLNSKTIDSINSANKTQTVIILNKHFYWFLFLSLMQIAVTLVQGSHPALPAPYLMRMHNIP